MVAGPGAVVALVRRAIRLPRRIAARILGRPTSHYRRQRDAVERASAYLRSLTDEDKTVLARRARRVLEVDAPAGEREASERLDTRSETVEVFCTLRRDGRRLGEARAAGPPLAALERAVGAARAAAGGEIASPDEVDVELSIVGGWVPLLRARGAQIHRLIEPGMNAIRLKLAGATAAVSAVSPVHRRQDLGRTLARLGVESGAGSAAWKLPHAELSLAGARYLVARGGGRSVLELRRGLLVDADDETPTRARLERALREGVGWLLRNQREDGSYAYQFEPRRAAFGPEDNLIRQAGTAYSVAAVGVALGDRACDESARRCIDYLLSHAALTEDERRLTYIRVNDDGSLGAVALTLLAIVHLEHTAPYDDVMRELGRSIVALQDPCGQLCCSFVDPQDYAGQGFYPGEALFALAVLHERAGDEAFRRCLERAFEYYPDWWKRDPDAAFIPWQTHVAHRMYRLGGEAKYAEFALRMTDWILTKAFRAGDAPFPDYVGGVGRPRPGISTGTYMEGITEAYALARDRGDRERVERYREAIVAAARFLLKLQFKEDEAHYLPAAKRGGAVGAFRLDLADHTLRIDATQHAMTALLNMLQLVDGAPWSADRG